VKGSSERWPGDLAGRDASREVAIPAGSATLPGSVTVPCGAVGIVVFAHGSGSSRSSPRNIEVAEALNEARLATLRFDLLTEAESSDRGKVFDIPLLAKRLAAATGWVEDEPLLRLLPIGYFGASTGAAAALWAAATDGASVSAIVSRGGRPDLASPRLAEVRAPTLLIVGGRDEAVLELNRVALESLRCEAQLRVVQGEPPIRGAGRARGGRTARRRLVRPTPHRASARELARSPPSLRRLSPIR
jgi:putative phosphoribosyl transferase